MRQVLLLLVHALTALVASAALCLLGLIVTVLLSLATTSSISIPGMTQTNVGEGSELASVEFLPATPGYFAGGAIVVFGALTLATKRRRGWLLRSTPRYSPSSTRWPPP